MKDSLLDPRFIRKAVEFQRIASQAVRKAQEESRRLDVPNVYFINGRTYYELSDGTLSLDDPYENDI